MDPPDQAGSPPPLPSARASLARLGRLIRKESMEIIRDRRTIITLVFMPLLLYPLLSVAFQQFLLAGSIDPDRAATYRFGFPSEQQATVFGQFLRYGEQLITNRAPTNDEGDVKVPPGPKLVAGVPPDLDKAVRDGEVDVAVHLTNAERFHLPLTSDVKLRGNMEFLSNNPSAIGAVTLVERRLAAVHEHNLAERMRDSKGQPKVALLRLSRTALAVAGGGGMISLAALVPLILILMTITGAVYPAIDLTAGERERGTLEILVAAPVPRLGLLFAKYVSVFSVAVLTAVVNLVSMVLTLVFSGLSEVLFAGGGLTPLLVLQLLGLLLLFAAFFSAVLLSLTSCARSFKEAQAYLIPLMLASLGPGLVGMIPGLSLEGPLAVVPLVNIVLLARDLVQGGADPAWALVVIVTTLAYAAGAVAVAARIFGAEGVLYNEQSGWADLLRRPMEPQTVATLAGALWCLVLMIPIYFTLQWLVRLAVPWLPTAGAYLAIGIVGVALFGLVPLLSAYMGRVRFASGFGLLPPRPAALLGGLLMGCTLWPLILQLLTVMLRDRSEQLKALLQPQLQNMSSARGLLIGVLVLQALLEEAFFRGYLFGALHRNFGATVTIAVAAILFGLAHVILGGALGWERLVPSVLLGVILGWVRWTSGSVVPGMMLHGSHNAILTMVPSVESLPPAWLIAGAMGSCAGSVLVWFGRKPASPSATLNK